MTRLEYPQIGRPTTSRGARHTLLWLLGVLGLYGILLLPTVRRQGIWWDEQTDLMIARSYLAQPDGWLAGSQDDPSQTRLPMFAVALVYTLLNTSDLITARVVSVLIGALTLIGVYAYCKRRFDHATGVLASALLATSPFFLSYARGAFTESDVYLACALAWLLVCVDRLQDAPTLRRGAAAGVVLGLALSAKATSLAVVPALWFGLWQWRNSGRNEADQRTGFPEERRITLLLAIGWIAICIFGGLSLVRAASATTYAGPFRLLHYLLVLTGWSAVLVWSAWRRERVARPFWLASFVTALAILTFFVIPPEHLTNPAIVQGLGGRLDHEVSFDPGFSLQAAALHLFSIIFKSGPLIGGAFLLSLVAAILQWPKRPEIRVPVLVVLGYFTGLILLPLAQTFYVVPILPILAILAADQFFRLLSRFRAFAIWVAAMAALLLSVDLALCYPDYNLNGYQWLGARWLAGSYSIGYRSVVQTPSDGIEQEFEWLNEHARPGETVLAYVMPWHIVNAVAPNPVYQIHDGFDGKIPAPDYVVFEINAMIPQSQWSHPRWWDVISTLDPRWLEANYTKVFSVERAFGIEMASVWRKR